MKKTMVVLLVMAMFLFSFNVFAQAQSSWSVKAGLDFGSTIDIDDADHDAGMGYSLIGEFKMPYRQNWNLGAGLAYQLDREEEINNVDFGFTPFYGLAEYRMQDSPLYFLGHLGYAGMRFEDNDSEEEIDSSGGLYYALGAGMDIGESYEAEVLYTSNTGELEYPDGETTETYEVDYSKITVTFGMRF